MTDMYWHFAECDENGTPRLRYNDGREIRVGETLTVDCEPVLCEAGLHASKRIIDALRYYPSNPVVTRVTLGGIVIHGDDKSVATERTVVAMLDRDTTDRILREFARWCALQVIHLWNAPDVVRQYLETGDVSLRAAAWAATTDAAWGAASASAWAAAGDARAAARDAAGAAGVAGDAAWASARDAQNEKLIEMVLTAMEAA